MYRSEAAFSRAICTEMRKQGLMVQRIESPETGVGIPDMWVAWRKATFIELKNQSRDLVQQGEYNIKWREGQQAWMTLHLKHTGQQCYTTVAMKDGFVLIPMDKWFVKNEVLRHDTVSFVSLSSMAVFIKKELL